MATKVIFLRRDSSTGKLVLSDPGGHTRAKKRDTIIWQVRPNSGVFSITNIEEKKVSQDIFAVDPYEQSRVLWRGEIDQNAPIYAEYNYSIYWKASEDGEELEHDPKISIEPSLSPFLNLVLALLSFFGLTFFIRLYFKEKKKW